LETLASDDDDAYYKISCSIGDNLKITLEVDFPTYDLDIYLYDSDQILLNYSQNAADIDEVSYSIIKRGIHYVRINRWQPSSGEVPFELTISGATSGIIIPGFEMISFLIFIISMISLISFRIIKRNNNKIIRK